MAMVWYRRLVGAADGQLAAAEEQLTGKKRKRRSGRAPASEARIGPAATLASEAGGKEADSWSVRASGIAELLTLLKTDGAVNLLTKSKYRYPVHLEESER